MFTPMYLPCMLGCWHCLIVVYVDACVVVMYIDTIWLCMLTRVYLSCILFSPAYLPCMLTPVSVRVPCFCYRVLDSSQLYFIFQFNNENEAERSS